MIVPSFLPRLSRRLDELRDAAATVPELREHLRELAVDRPADFAGEVLVLLSEPRLGVAIDALIFGTCEAWWSRRPLLRAAVVAELRRIAGLPPRRTAWAAAS
jgi:hypothetical protein